MSTTPPASPPRGGLTSDLLDKTRRLGLQLPLDLERLALLRGCDYYARDLGPQVSPQAEVPLSTAELAVALIAPSLAPGAREIRLAAALLGGPDVTPEEVAALAVQEHGADIVSYIAQCGRRFEPENPFWSSLLSRLPDRPIDPARLPHPTRFVEMTGIDRGRVGLQTRWIRPRRAAA